MRGFILLGCLVLVMCFALICVAFFESLRGQQKLLQVQGLADQNHFQLIRKLEDIGKEALAHPGSCQYAADKIPEVFEGLRISAAGGCLYHEKNMEIRYVIAEPMPTQPQMIFFLARAEATAAWQRFLICGKL